VDVGLILTFHIKKYIKKSNLFFIIKLFLKIELAFELNYKVFSYYH